MPEAEGISRGSSSAVDRLAEVLSHGELLVLTGAGVSTDSGIPDYRDESGAWKRPAPMQYREFVTSDAARRRYWARSLLGFQALREARPNPAHVALSSLEKHALLRLLVTQNVDGLHQVAGSQSVVDLHGRIDRVICVSCRNAVPRTEVQHMLAELNPRWLGRVASVGPDGDADLGKVDCADFRVVPCEGCGGVLKPDVVFFGENVPKDRVERAMDALGRARALLVVGSSLMVFSGYRFVRAAERLGVPVLVVNRGHSRADRHAALKVEGNAGEVLSESVLRLGL